jgi:hypothetical protein
MLEDSNEMLRARSRFIPVSGVEGWLAAASLIFRELDGVPKSAQHRDRVNCHLRQQLIHKARDE